MTNKEIDELYDALEEFHQPEKEISSKSSLEERIIAGFDEINSFYEENNRPPFFGEDRDIFEKEYALRLNAIRQDKDMCSLLKDYDKYFLLKESLNNNDINVDEDTLLNELKDLSSTQDDITSLVYVKPRAEIKAAEEIAQRVYCNDFYRFKDIFTKAQSDLNSGLKTTIPFKDDAKIQLGELFILNGQKAYIAEIGQDFKNSNGVFDARLRIIFDNKTESSMLRRSFQRALNKDEKSRRIINLPDLPLFSDETMENDISSGAIYVLRSNSDCPQIKENREIIHNLCTCTDLPNELIVYGRTPLLNMNYCLLGETDKCYPTCKQRCITDNIYELKDRLHMNFRILPDNIQTVTTIFNSKITSIYPKEFNIDYARIDVLDETIEEINEIIHRVHNNQRFDGSRYTNGNLNKEL